MIKEKYNALSKPVKASFWFALCSFAQKGISFITVPIFTRLMSAEQYGMFSLYQSWDSVIIVFATLNLSYQVFNNGLVKYEDDQEGYTSSMLGLSNACTTILLGLYLIFQDQVNAFTGLSTSLFLLMFLQYYFNQALALWTVKERFFYRYRLLVAIAIVSSVVSSALGVAAVILCDDKVFARIASLALVNIVVGVGIYANILRGSRKMVCLKYWKFALALNLPLIPHYLAMTVLGSSDRIMIASICGASFTAYYSVAYNVASIMTMLISSINSSYIPWFYQRMRDEDGEAVSRVSRMLLVIVGAVCLAPALFGPEVVMILGSEAYLEGIWVIPPVSAGVYFTFLYTLFSNYELFYENSKLIMVASIGAAALNVILNFVFLPVFGFVAAGYTTLACYISLALFHYWGMRRVAKQDARRSVPFDTKTVLFVSVALAVLSVGVSLLYFNDIVRYAAIICAALMAFAKRKTLAKVFKEMKSR